MLSDYCRKLRTTTHILLFIGLLAPAFAAANGGSDSTNVSIGESLLHAKDVAIRSFLVEKAKQFQGLRYRYGGVSPKTGFDCSGFTAYIMKQFNIALDHSSRAQGSTGRQIALKETRPGDLIVFRRSSRSSISHVAMVVSNDENGLYMIHSCSRGILVENLYESDYWRPKVYMARDVVSESLTQAVFPDELQDIELPTTADNLAQADTDENPAAALSEEDKSILTTLGRQIAFCVAR